MDILSLNMNTTRLTPWGTLYLLWAVGCTCALSPVKADTNDWIDATMLKLKTIDFEFSRSESAVPFLPVLSAGHTIYGKTEFASVEGGGQNVTFRTQSSYAYAMVPLYVGDSGLAVAVPCVSHTWFHFTEGDMKDGDATAVYLPFGAMWQTEGKTQWGWFLMPSAYSPLSSEGDWAASGMGGVMGRYMSGDRLTWYYGVVYDYGFSDGYFLPYAGFSYVIDPTWAISMIAPWPSVSYAPSDKFFVQLGVSPSGASWALDRSTENGDKVMASFGGWDLGLWGNWRVGPAWWLSAGGGVSGLRSLQVDPNGDANFDQKVGSEPWVGITLSLRPN